MNREERLRENRREYQDKFLLGFGRGKGLLSVLILALFNFLKKRGLIQEIESEKKEEANPSQFDILE